MTKRLFKKCRKKLFRIVAEDLSPPGLTWRQRDYFFALMERAVRQINSRPQGERITSMSGKISVRGTIG